LVVVDPVGNKKKLAKNVKLLQFKTNHVLWLVVRSNPEGCPATHPALETNEVTPTCTHWPAPR
jgi:hypothetical protein